MISAADSWVHEGLLSLEVSHSLLRKRAWRKRILKGSRSRSGGSPPLGT
jgi:hypothetical protein